jgi:hypothetical protein
MDWMHSHAAAWERERFQSSGVRKDKSYCHSFYIVILKPDTRNLKPDMPVQIVIARCASALKVY